MKEIAIVEPSGRGWMHNLGVQPRRMRHDQITPEQARVSHLLDQPTRGSRVKTLKTTLPPCKLIQGSSRIIPEGGFSYCFRRMGPVSEGFNRSSVTQGQSVAQDL